MIGESRLRHGLLAVCFNGAFGCASFDKAVLRQFLPILHPAKLRKRTPERALTRIEPATVQPNSEDVEKAAPIAAARRKFLEQSEASTTALLARSFEAGKMASRPEPDSNSKRTDGCREERPPLGELSKS
jgi:hypothetical protein